MKNTARALLLALAVSSVSPGCATLGGALPEILAAVQDSQLVLDAIDAFVHQVMRSKNDPAMLDKIEGGMARARTALDAALRLARGSKDLDDARVQEGFAEFQRAYEDLVVLVRALGVRVDAGGGRMQATATGLSVPPAAVLLPRRSK